MRIKIISNGDIYGTQVIDPVSGERIEGVTKVEFVADGQSARVEAVVHIEGAQLDVLADATNNEDQ